MSTGLVSVSPEICILYKYNRTSNLLINRFLWKNFLPHTGRKFFCICSILAEYDLMIDLFPFFDNQGTVFKIIFGNIPGRV